MDLRLRFVIVAATVLLHMGCAHGQATPATGEITLPSVKALTMMATAIACSDIDRSLDFYTKGLGMTSRGRMEMGLVIEAPVMFPGGGAYLLLQTLKAEGAAQPARGSLNRVIVMVPDLQVLEARLNSAGYKLKGSIKEMPQFKVAVAHVEDPDGNPIELIQRLP